MKREYSFVFASETLTVFLTFKLQTFKLDHRPTPAGLNRLIEIAVYHLSSPFCLHLSNLIPSTLLNIAGLNTNK